MDRLAVPLRPIARRNLTGAVFDQLVAGIVAGDLAPGDALPSERRLAEVLQVSRPAVREALQRLAQSGLVDIRQGDATTVRDYRRHAGPELLPTLLTGDAGLDLRVARSIVEVRAMVGPGLAELAAERGGPDAAADLAEVLEAMALDGHDAVALQRHALTFWDRLVDASDSIALRLLFNALAAAYEPVLEVLAAVLADEVGDVASYRALTEAVAARDGAGARRTAEALLARGTSAVLGAIDALLDPDVEDAR